VFVNKERLLNDQIGVVDDYSRTTVFETKNVDHILFGGTTTDFYGISDTQQIPWTQYTIEKFAKRCYML